MKMQIRIQEYLKQVTLLICLKWESTDSKIIGLLLDPITLSKSASIVAGTIIWRWTVDLRMQRATRVAREVTPAIFAPREVKSDRKSMHVVDNDSDSSPDNIDYFEIYSISPTRKNLKPFGLLFQLMEEISKCKWILVHHRQLCLLHYSGSVFLNFLY